jgi:hypothetical protein
MSDIQNPRPGAQNIRDASEHALRGTRTGDLAISQAHGKYLEAVRSGRVWTVSTPAAGITVTANMLFSVASSNAILGLYNKTSDQYLHILRANVQTVTATVCNIVWAITTPLAIAVNPTGVDGRNNLDFSSGGHKAVAFNGSVAVSGHGVTSYYRPIVALPTGAGRVSQTEEDGDIVIPPYGFAGVYGDAVTTATVIFGSLVWEEVPV